MRFDKKVAIVTGGTTGMGKETCIKLSGDGAIVYNFDLNMAEDVNYHYVKCDVSRYGDVTNSVKLVFEKEGRIDLLFTNAGIHLSSSIDDTDLDDLDRIISINLKGVFYTLKEVIPIMINQNHGKIVLMGSDQSLIGKRRSAAYGMTKGAIGQLTKSAAIDYAKYNINVNCVCPGTIDTPMLHKAISVSSATTGMSKEIILESLKKSQPIRRIASPAEIANVVCFLLSDESDFMTGSLVSVDGGYTCQ
ncbi:SDR family oxidoreductase [Desulfobacterales bacterium HSG2]|nr:SDR family oxidoreductase [Desulfobacterales bacterium HSG2]